MVSSEEIMGAQRTGCTYFSVNNLFGRDMRIVLSCQTVRLFCKTCDIVDIVTKSKAVKFTFRVDSTVLFSVGKLHSIQFL